MQPANENTFAPLRCPVRNCGLPLALLDACLKCQRRHSFDRAKHGYWSLLQPQDHKSLNAGDCDEAVDARQQWLELGHMDKLVTLIQSDFLDLDLRGKVVADLGCGEGAFSRAVFESTNCQFLGLDLSKRALRLASRKWPSGTWILANADRTLPLLDASCDLVTSFFGRRPISEIRRILHPNGHCLIAVPGAHDLIQLREKAQTQGIQRNRIQPIVQDFQSEGFELRKHLLWEDEVNLGRPEILTAMQMTYRAAKNSQRARLDSSKEDRLRVTLAADILLFAKEHPGAKL